MPVGKVEPRLAKAVNEFAKKNGFKAPEFNEKNKYVIWDDKKTFSYEVGKKDSSGRYVEVESYSFEDNDELSGFETIKRTYINFKSGELKTDELHPRTIFGIPVGGYILDKHSVDIDLDSLKKKYSKVFQLTRHMYE